ncbi:MAG: glutamate--tRNA ligase [Armatimonadetes bacterium]|nr:glutamate--tRNA ligase [Armatimonadota bacterium]
MSVRVRFAPSPTGSPHVGNIRTALFNHLFAKHHGGVHILRIEDTDSARFVEGCEEEIIESLLYIGVEWQEGVGKGGPHGPYHQSERKERGIYKPIFDRLLESGHAYWAFETSEELKEMREYQQINKQPIGYYGGVWRDASGAKVEEARSAGLPGVVRLKIPRDETIVLNDAIRGRVEINSNLVDDPVLIKNDGMPTYHFAAMVDDHLMDITHVFRGEEWISSAPKHVTLFKSLGWDPPEFIHVPIIKGKDGSKLSKRHGDTACLDFRRAGYLTEAISNFIALIGWSPGGDREVMSMDEMAEAFTIEGIQPSPGVFDLDKLNWMNGHYIRAMDAGTLASMVRDYSSCDENQEYWAGREPDHQAAKGKPTPAENVDGMKLLVTVEDLDYVQGAITLEQERVANLAEFGPACKFFFVESPDMEQKAVDKWFKHDHVRALFDHLTTAFDGKKETSAEECESILRGFMESAGVEKFGPVVHPTRVALTGKTVGPGLFELMSLLGPARIVKRVERAKKLLP